MSTESTESTIDTTTEPAASWKDLAPQGAELNTDLQADERSNDEWRQILDDEQFQVLRKEGTERAFTNPLNDEKREGLFVCAACELPLFTSRMKYDSGTGWPSFYDTIEDHVVTKRDFKLFVPRTEYHCARCDGHQGHVFGDGPEPTGKRYCNNGVALRFLPKDGSEE